ncbi:MAG: AMP-binding protein [Spirochaetota bacterium]
MFIRFLENKIKLYTANVLVSQDKQKYTFAEVHDFILRFHFYFQKYNIRNKKIAILMPKSKEYVVSFLAVLASSNTLIPIDRIKTPKYRVQFILENSQADYIISDLVANDFGINTIHYHTLLRAPQLVKKFADNKKQDSAYIIYTSGSSGKPKGVHVSYSGLLNVIQSQISILNLSEENIFWFQSLNFDASISDILCSVFSGSTLFIEEEVILNPVSLQNYINNNQIHYIDIPPSYLPLLDVNKIYTLRKILIGGEIADNFSIQKFLEHGIEVLNVYGPTEATICSSFILCDRNFQPSNIGIPIAGVLYQISDVGELLISGENIALGYINVDENHNNRFQDGVYHTGDKVEFTNGEYHFKGRIDRQVKLYGQMVCPEEIEMAIAANCDLVESSYVVIKGKKIYAYIQGECNKQEVEAILRKLLPSYMIPHYILNTSFASNTNGKRDLKKVEDDEVIIFLQNLLTNANIDSTLTIQELGADSLETIEFLLFLESIHIKVDYRDLVTYPIGYFSHGKREECTYKVSTFELLKQLPDISLSETLHQHQTKVLFITGASGNLGSCLLKKHQTSFTKIYALSRYRQKSQDNIIWLQGDVSLPFFSLEEQEYQQLAKEVDTVIHCAANVNHLLSFEELYQDNVQSTVEIIKFCFHSNLKKLHYASTLSVVIAKYEENDRVVTNDTLVADQAIHLLTGYAQSKWLSEYLVQKYVSQASIYRYGLLIPENEILPDTHYLSLLESFAAEYKELPIEYSETSFDYSLLKDDILMIHSKSGIYNKSSNKFVTLKDFFLQEPISWIPIDKWMQKYGHFVVAKLWTKGPFYFFKTTGIDHFL